MKSKAWLNMNMFNLSYKLLLVIFNHTNKIWNLHTSQPRLAPKVWAQGHEGLGHCFTWSQDH